MFQVVEVFVPAGRLFVPFEVGQIDQIHFHVVPLIHDPGGLTLFKGDSGNTGENLNPDGRKTYSDDLILFEKDISGEGGEIETKFFESSNDSFSIWRIRGDPHIQIGRSSRIAVKGHGVATNEEVLNAMKVE
jgi:hypothetical protein